MGVGLPMVGYVAARGHQATRHQWDGAWNANAALDIRNAAHVLERHREHLFRRGGFFWSGESPEAPLLSRIELETNLAERPLLLRLFAEHVTICVPSKEHLIGRKGERTAIDNEIVRILSRGAIAIVLADDLLLTDHALDQVDEGQRGERLVEAALEFRTYLDHARAAAGSGA